MQNIQHFLKLFLQDVKKEDPDSNQQVKSLLELKSY